jgi:tetratricopeptide (TPR) repeat protein
MQHIIHAFHPDAKLPESVEDLRSIYCSVLQENNRCILLLLDNAAGADQIALLLPPPNCLLLVTSRLHFTLPGLQAKNIDCLHPEESIKLLNKLAPRIEQHAARAAELCGHLPLALEIFAGVVNDKRLYPVAELVQRLAAKQEKLSKVDAAFEVSYDLLAEPLCSRWCQLAVLPGSFDLLAAAAVCGISQDDACDRVQTLVNASLVEWNETVNRFRLHDLARQFCDSKLGTAERAAAQQRHASHYCGVLAAANQLFLQGNDGIMRGLALFDSERINIETGHDWAVSQSADNNIAARLCVAFSGEGVSVIRLRHHARQSIPWLEAAIAAAKRLGSRQAEGAALGNLGIAYASLGENHRAIEFYEKASVIAREIGDRREECASLGNLGLAYVALGETRRSAEFCEKALVIAREIGNRRDEGNSLGNLGIAYLALGESRRAIELFEQHLTVAREIGDRRSEGNALDSLGLAYSALGKTRRAIEFHERTLVISREIGDRSSEGNALWNSALDFEQLGNRVEAAARAEGALEIFQQIEDPNAAAVQVALTKWRAES